MIKGGTSGKDDIAVKVLSDINITSGDSLIGHFVETENLTTLDNLIWEEEGFWGHESWLVELYDLTIWKFVVLGVFV